MASTLELMNAAKLSLYDNKPVGYFLQAVTQSIPNSAYTALTFDTVLLDNWGGWSAGDTTKYTVKLAGKYKVSGQAYLAGNATGSRFTRAAYNGGGVGGGIGEVGTPGAVALTVPTPVVIVQAVVGDFFQIATFQSTGGALSTNASTSNASSFTVEWISF